MVGRRVSARERSGLERTGGVGKRQGEPPGCAGLNWVEGRRGLRRDPANLPVAGVGAVGAPAEV